MEASVFLIHWNPVLFTEDQEQDLTRYFDLCEGVCARACVVGVPYCHQTRSQVTRFPSWQDTMISIQHFTRCSAQDYALFVMQHADSEVFIRYGWYPWYISRSISLIMIIPHFLDIEVLEICELGHWATRIAYFSIFSCVGTPGSARLVLQGVIVTLNILEELVIKWWFVEEWFVCHCE